jgi:hypothetical protein
VGCGGTRHDEKRTIKTGLFESGVEEGDPGGLETKCKLGGLIQVSAVVAWKGGECNRRPEVCGEWVTMVCERSETWVGL